MRIEATYPRTGEKPALAWASAIALTFGLLFGSSNASAAPPPANTVIGNQASASYTDPSGVLQLATSNLVQTTIQQVGSFTLDGFNQPTTNIVNTSSGAAGTIIYAPHVLTNTGNGTDTFTIRAVDDNSRFSRVEVFADSSLNGKPTGPALCTATPTPCVISAQSVAGNNGVFQFLVAYTIPATATTPTTPYDTATITATPGTPALYTASNSSVVDKDQVNLTTLAAFMLDSNGDGIADTGPVAAGASTNFVVRVTLPAGVAVASGPYTAIIRGTSAGDSSKIEATRDTLTSVIGSLVDLTNSAAGTGIGSVGGGDLGPGPSPSPTTTVTTPAGQGAIFPLFIKNNDTAGPATQTYTLQASQSNSFPGNLPIGWSVKFVASGAGCSGTGITTTTVAAGAQQAIEACVTPPSNQLPVIAQVIYFRVLSSNSASTGASVSDTKTDAVTVTSAQTYSATLSPSNSGQVSLPGSVTYAHTLTNTGTQSCVGPYTLAATLSPADTAAGWTAVLYLDNGDGILDASAGDTLVTGPRPGPLTVGTSEKYLVKVFAPGSATTGNASTVTITATFPTGAGSWVRLSWYRAKISVGPARSSQKAEHALDKTRQAERCEVQQE